MCVLWTHRGYFIGYSIIKAYDYYPFIIYIKVLSPTSKSSRSDSRTSFGSIFDSVVKDKSNDRVSIFF